MPTRGERLRAVTHAGHDRAIRESCAFCRGWYITILATNVDRFVDGRNDFDRVSDPERGRYHDPRCAFFVVQPPRPKETTLERQLKASLAVRQPRPPVPIQLKRSPVR